MAKITIPIIKKNKKNVVEVMALDDHFQFNFTRLLSNFEFDEHWKIALQETNQMVEEDGVDTFATTQPYASLYFTECFLINLRANLNNAKVSGLELVEYDYPQVEQRTKKNSQPTKQIVDRHMLDFTLSQRLVHLPQIIAEHIFNIPDSEIDYDARVEYTKSILQMYASKYGQLFESFFNLDVMNSIDIPAANLWNNNFKSGMPTAIISYVNIEDEEEDFDEEPIIESTPEPTVVATPQPAQPVQVNPPTTTYDQYIAPEPVNEPQFDPVLNISINKADVQTQPLTVEQVPPANEVDNTYVDYKINELKKQLNEQRFAAIEVLNSSAQERLATEISKSSDSLLAVLEQYDEEHDAATKTTEKLDAQITAAMNKEHASRTILLEEQKTNDLKAEDERHERLKREILANHAAQVEALFITIQEEIEPLRQTKYAEMLEEFKTEINMNKQALIEQNKQEVMVALDPVVAELKAASTQYMNGLVAAQTAELAEKEQLYRDSHIKAVQLENEKMALITHKNDQMSSIQSYETLANQFKATAEARHVLENELASKAAEVRTLNENVVVKRELDAITDLGAKVEQFKLLATDHQRKPSRMSGLKSMAIGIASAAGVLIVTGTGYLMTQQNSMLNEANSTVTKMTNKVEALEKKQVTLEKGVEADTKTEDTKTDTETKPATPAKTDFSKLDENVAAEKLTVYDESFKNKNLETNARTMAVGKLLIMDGRTSEALTLANANQGHNQDLLKYIAELTAQIGN